MEVDYKKQFEDQLAKNENKLEAINKGLESRAKSEDLQKLQSSVETIQDFVSSVENLKFGEKDVKLLDAIKNLQTQADKNEKDIKERLKEINVHPKGLNEKIKGLLESDAWKNTAKSGNKFVIEKAANDILTADATADSGAVGLPQMQLPGVTKYPWRATPIFAAVPKRTVGMEHEVSYTEELSRSDAAALKSEGATQYAQSGATWITRILAFYNFGHFVKISQESLEDIDYVQQEMNDLLSNGLLRAIEVLLYGGSGSSTVLGVANAAKTFAKTLGMKGVTSPSMRDILMAAKLQVSKGVNATTATDANKTGYMANLALIGKSSSYNVTTEKDDINRPLVDNLDSWRPGGLSVVESEDVTETDSQRDFVVGDFSKAMLYLKRNLTIETGFDGNDFTDHMITLRASIRGNLLIKNLEKYAFVKGDFETAPALIGA